MIKCLRSKRSIRSEKQLPTDFIDMSNELLSDDILNVPLTQLDLELIERTPAMKQLLIRKLESLCFQCRIR